MPNLRSKTWTTTTPANVGDAQYWEDHLISDAAAAKAASSVQSVNGITPDQNGNVDIGNAGHTIQDDDGNDMPKQDVLQFVNADVTNDTVNEKTVVDCKGAKGDAATITVGTVTTLPAGSDATVTNSGTSHAAVFNFGIPQGEDGAGAVDSVNGKTGTVVLTATDIGALPDNAPVILTSTTAGLVKNDGTIDTTEYQTKLSFDTAPVKDSTKPVESGGIYDALAPKVSETLFNDTVGWVGKNELQFDLKSLKSVNTAGTWSGNVYTRYGTTFTVNESDNTIVVNNSPSATAEFFLATRNDATNPNILADGKYTGTGCPEGGSDSTYMMYFDTNNTNGSINRMVTDVGNGGDFTITYNESTTYPSNRIQSVIRIMSGATVNNLVFKPMIRKASITDSTYEPYHKSVEDWYWENNPNAGVHNLIPIDMISHTSTGGITFTVNANKSITINAPNTQTGTNGEKVWEGVLPRGKYIFSTHETSQGNDIHYAISAINGTTWLRNIVEVRDTDNQEFTIDYNDYDRVRVMIWIKTSVAINNKTCYPMIRDVRDTNPDFAPYAMTNRELTEINEQLKNGKIIGNTIASSAANQSWAVQLAALNTAWGNMTGAQKRNAKILVGGDTFVCTNIDTGSFGLITCASIDNTPTVILKSLRLTSQIAYRMYVTSTGNTVNDDTSATNTSSVVLISGV